MYVLEHLEDEKILHGAASCPERQPPSRGAPWPKALPSHLLVGLRSRWARTAPQRPILRDAIDVQGLICVLSAKSSMCALFPTILNQCGGADAEQSVRLHILVRLRQQQTYTSGL